MSAARLGARTDFCHTRGMRRTLIPVLLAASLLSACSSSGEDEPSSTGSPEASGTLAPGSTATPSTSVAPGDDSSVDAGADAFCGPALEGARSEQQLLEATDRKSSETGVADDGGSVEGMNAAGEDMVRLVGEVETSWGEADALLATTTWDDSAAQVSTADVDGAFDDFAEYLEVWALPEAQIAADAASIAEYDAAAVELLATAASTEMAAKGGTALGQILVYTQERCGLLESMG